MTTWPMVPLGEVLQLQRRWIKLHPTETYREIGIRSFGKGIFHKAPIAGITLGNKRVLRIEPGDLVFNNVFAWEGAVAVAGPEETGMIGSHRFITYSVDPTKSTAEFLKLFFATPGGLELLMKASPGSAGRNKTLGLDRFISQSIPLPPLAEQRRVVARIEELAAQIHEARTLRQQADDEADALIASSATCFFRCGEWEMTTISDLAGQDSLRNGKSVKSDETGTGIHCLTLSAMRLGKINTRIKKPVPLTTAEADPYLIGKGDVFIVRGNGSKELCGLAGLVEEDIEGVIFPDLFIRVSLPKERVLPEFFVAIWNSAATRRTIEDKAKTTSGIWKINQGHITSTEIPIPPLAEQRRIVAELDALQAEVGALKRLQAETAAELDALLPAILDRAFKGEL